MRKQRKFSPDFKRQVVEELLSGISTPSQLSRRHDIASGLLYHWKKQYAKGSFGNEPTKEAALKERVRQLDLRERVFKKSSAPKPRTREEKRKFIANHQCLLESVERGCILMDLPRSSYYYRPQTKGPDDKLIVSRIEEIVEELPGYGYRRVTAQLHREGIFVNHKKVLRLMRAHGLTRKPKRRWVKTTDSDHRYPVYQNLVNGFRATGVNQVWTTDITYISLKTSFVYLAAIIDLFSRKAIGYAISSRIDTALCLKALAMAIEKRKPSPGVIHHSDRGVQYASGDYVDMLLLHGFTISMARKGNPYDNAVAESFIKTLKTEEVYLWEYRTLADVKKRLPYFIEEVYNQKRLHSALGYRPPVEFEEMFLTAQTHQNSCLATLT